MLGIVFILFGVYLFYGAHYKAKLFDNVAQNKLLTTGVYSIVRNPVYSAFLLACTGVVCIAANYVLFAIPVICWAFMTIILKHSEEKWLRNLYGYEYVQYTKRVNRCIPWFVKPEKSDDMKTNVFYKMIAGVYDLLDVVYFRKFESSPRKAVIDAISENDTILDLCTGTATNAMGISKAIPSVKIVGVDLSENMLDVAKGKVENENIKNIELYRMDATKLKFKAESFDKILLSLVLHEMTDELRSKILAEAKRVLKKDGKIIITEWERSKNVLKRVLFLPIHLFEPKPYRKFLKADLYSYFAKHGLKIEEYNHCDYTKVLVLKA